MTLRGIFSGSSDALIRRESVDGNCLSDLPETIVKVVWFDVVAHQPFSQYPGDYAFFWKAYGSVVIQS